MVRSLRLLVGPLNQISVLLRRKDRSVWVVDHTKECLWVATHIDEHIAAQLRGGKARGVDTQQDTRDVLKGFDTHVLALDQGVYLEVNLLHLSASIAFVIDLLIPNTIHRVVMEELLQYGVRLWHT
jgi:hypothetical protein